MKKYLSVLLLIVFVVPQVALASWWNPISWFNNWSFINKQIKEVKQLEKEKNSEEKISELQKQLDELKNKETETSFVDKSNQEIKNIPKIDNSVMLKVKQDALLSKQKAEEEIKINSAKDEADKQAKIEEDKKKIEAEKLQKEIDEIRINSAKIEAETQAKIELDKQIKIENERLQKEIEEVRISNNKAIEKENKLDVINLKIANLNAKYTKDKKEIQSRPMAQGAIDAAINNLYDKYLDEYNTLTAEWQQVKYSE